MTQYASINDATDEILGLVNTETEPTPGNGRRYEQVSPPLAACPDAPFQDAVWKWGESGPYWHDPRTTERRAEQERFKRDALLLATDWMVTRAIETSTSVPSAWAAYRASLRAVPEQQGFPNNINWPEEPGP